MKPATKVKEESFGELEYVRPNGQYTAWNLGRGVAVLMRTKDTRNLTVGFKKKRSSMVIYLEKKKPVKRDKQE